MTHPFDRMKQALAHSELEFEEYLRLEYDRRVAHKGFPTTRRLGHKVAHKPTLDLREYIVAEVQAPTAVHRPLPPYGDAWLNTQLGTCGEGMAINGVRAFHSEAKTPIPPFADGDAEFLYEKVGDYNPDAPLVNGQNPTDQGTDNNVLVNYWKSPGILCRADGSVHQIVDSVFVDPNDENLTKLAIWEFVVNFRAYGLPATAEQQQGQWTVQGDGKTGDSALATWGYHDIAQTSFGPRNVGLETWGLPWMAAWPFDVLYAVQGFAVVTQEQRNLQGVSPAGIDWTKLNADLGKLPTGPSN